MGLRGNNVIVDPDFMDHWRTRMLVGLLGSDEMAPIYVLRLWAHCQNRKKWIFDLPAAALQSICHYVGDAQAFESAMEQSGFTRRVGVDIEVVGWAEYNAALIAAWNNGSKGGRPRRKQPCQDPIKPMDNPRDSRWALKTADEILADVNEILVSAWTSAGYAVMPSHLGLPPVQFGLIATAKVSQAGNVSILKYILDNNILTTSGRGKLNIFPMKWLTGAGVGGTIGTLGTVDRMIAYTKEKERVRYPMTLLQRTPIQYDSIYHKSTYYGRLGVVEIVYPETIAYRDGI